MTTPSPAPTELAKADVRRLQVLEAASKCFRRHGFHGTSMTELSKEAGMSVGHIYHYFENKEAIIAAIVELSVQRAIKAGTDLQARRPDPANLASMVDVIDRKVIDEVLDDPDAALMLEVVAEAARNEKIATIVRTENAPRTEWSRQVLIDTQREREGSHDESRIDGQVAVMDALFDGLAIQTIIRPDLDRDAMVRAVRGAVRGILEF